MSTSTSLTDLHQRQMQKHVFRLKYEHICKANNKNVLKGVTCHLAENKLDFLGDRIKLEDWVMIINAIKNDRSLHMIALRSRYPSKIILDHVDDHDKARRVTRHPLLYTKHVLYNAMSALHACLRRSRALVGLELEGLPLNAELLEMMVDGVRRCATLRNLSLYRCEIGDEGVAVVCKVLKDLPSVVQLDFSGCGVTACGAELVAQLLKYQSLQRCGEEWKQSLRYRVPDIDTFPGLRRVTLNHNRHIGDSGARHVLDTLKDDLWLKALDMQNCGLSNDTAVLAISLLDINTCLAVVDLRANDVSHSLEALIMHALLRNMEMAVNQDGGAVEKHNWLDVESCLRPRKTRSTSLSVAPTTSRCLTPVTPHRHASGGVTQRPSTCMPAMWQPAAAASDTASLGGVTVTSAAPLARCFMADRLREDTRELMLELAAEVAKRDEALAVGARHGQDLQDLRRELEEERQMRLRAQEDTESLEHILRQLEEERSKRDREETGRMMEAGDNKNADASSHANQSQRATYGTKKARSLHAAPHAHTSPRKLKIWSNPQALDEEMNKIFAESRIGDSRIRSQCSSVRLGNDARSTRPSRATKLFNLMMADRVDPIKGDDNWTGRNYPINGEAKREGNWYEKDMGDGGKDYDRSEKSGFDKGDSRKGGNDWSGKRFGDNSDLNKRVSDWCDKKMGDMSFPMKTESESSMKIPQWMAEESDF